MANHSRRRVLNAQERKRREALPLAVRLRQLLDDMHDGRIEMADISAELEDIIERVDALERGEEGLNVLTVTAPVPPAGLEIPMSVEAQQLADVASGAVAQITALVQSVMDRQNETQKMVIGQRADAIEVAKKELGQKLTAVRQGVEQILGDLEIALKERPIVPDHRHWHALVDTGGMAAHIDDWQKWGNRLSRICSDGGVRLTRVGV